MTPNARLTTAYLIVADQIVLDSIKILKGGRFVVLRAKHLFIGMQAWQAGDSCVSPNPTTPVRTRSGLSGTRPRGIGSP